MKINETQRLSAVSQYQTQQSIQRTGKAPMKKDELSISAEAKEMLNAQQSQDPARTERIQALKHAVSTGTYKVEADKIAEKLMPYFRPKA